MKEFATLRELISRSSGNNWSQLLKFFEEWPDSEQRDIAILYAKEHLVQWPSKTRTFPSFGLKEYAQQRADWIPFQLAVSLDLSNEDIGYKRNIKYFLQLIPLIKNVEILNLNWNKLEHLPSEIGRLENLRILHLYNNKLENLPDELTQLKKLEMLDLRENELETLPDGFRQLKNLEFLYLEGNELGMDDIPVQSKKGIATFLRKNG